MVMGTKLETSKPIVLLASGAEGFVVAHRPSLRDRMTAQWRPARLDRALAEGVPPEASPALALRAHRLTEPDRRWSMAGALRRIVREADGNCRPRLRRVNPNRAAVRAARESLGRLADTLDDPGPVAAHGAARAWLLMTDGTSPLYNPRSRTTLVADAARAMRELRPWPA
jgi:hypothetical protein